jgi:hypothetical protein
MNPRSKAGRGTGSCGHPEDYYSCLPWWVSSSWTGTVLTEEIGLPPLISRALVPGSAQAVHKSRILHKNEPLDLIAHLPGGRDLAELDPDVWREQKEETLISAVFLG